ncbi:sensor histidine kinase [Lachnospiraceae bacterium KM106-2]|nr:sensor histidine kinase [Lachnospiraceae bacterium KM106-2]
MFYTIITEVVAYYLLFYVKGLINSLVNMKESSGKGLFSYIWNIPIEDKEKLLDGASPNAFSYNVKSLLLVNKDYLTITIVLAVTLGLVLFIIYFLLLTRRLSNYLDEITEGINEITEGNFDVRIRIKDDDEFAGIARSINKMASEIGSMYKTEKNQENIRQELITNVTHDLRTPLTSIIGYLELARRSNTTKEDEKHYLAVAYDKSKRLEQLIEDLFSYTKFSSGEVKLNQDTFDLVKFMEQMVDEFYPSFQEYELQYEFSAKSPSVMIQADANLLARAVANLISNAVKYGKDGKKIKVWVETEENQAIISVMNYGEVIPEKELVNVFDKFYRVESSRSQATGGTGLGLAIAKKIIVMHQGDIALKSDLDGTVFTIKLPLEMK